MASFQLKNFASIAISMINRMKATQSVVTDFNIGGVGRTLVESPAIEIDQLYQQAFNLVSAAIPVSVYSSFSFTKLPALPASGLLTLQLAAQPVAVLVSAGTQCTATTTKNVYTVSADTIIPAGTTSVTLQVAALTTGASSNLSSSSVFTLTPSVPGFVSASNALPFVNGRDLETDPEQFIRFNAYISTLQRGTVPAIQYGLSLATVLDSAGNIAERVAFSSVVEPYVTDNTQPIALVNAYIHNGVGNTSGALVAAAAQVIAGYYAADGTAVPGWKAAGVPVNIFPATEVPVPVVGTLTAATGYDKPTLIASAAAVLGTYITSIPPGQTALFAQMITLVKNIPGVANFKIFTPAPGTDTASTPSTKLMPGAITIT